MTNVRRISVSLVAAIAVAFALISFRSSDAATKSVKTPTVVDWPDGTRKLLLPDDITAFLQQEFPNNRFPAETEFSPEMLDYYRSRLIGVHPAVAFGDFNGDKKKDYMVLLITGDTKWGPLCELVIAEGEKKGFEVFRLGEIYNFKDDYVSFADNKLYKGRYKKGGWYINLNKKTGKYDVTKG